MTAVIDRKTLEMEQEAMALVRKAKMHVCIYHCFYGALLERLKLRVDWRCETMYTDAVVIGFNPAFVLSKSWEHLVYIMVHEVTHCALGHPFRRGNRIPKIWQQAIDHVTNLALNRDPELEKMFPPEGLADKRFEGLSAEQVYSILEAEQEKQGDGQEGDGDQPQDGGLAGAAGSMGDCCDAGASGEPLPPDEKPDAEDGDDADDDGNDGDGDEADGEEAKGGKGKKKGKGKDHADADGDGNGNEEGDEQGEEDAVGGADQASDDIDGADPTTDPSNPANIERLAREWEEATMTATLAAGGEVTDVMTRTIGTARECNKSFDEYVDEFAQAAIQSDPSWNRPARRFEPYLPSNCIPNIKVLVVAVDTSISIGKKQLGLMEGAANRVMQDFNLKACIVVYCDTAIRGIERFEMGDYVTLENAKGGGGTSFHPPLRYALEQIEQGEDLAGVMYLTDLEGRVSDPEDFVDLKILWASTLPVKSTTQPPQGLGMVCGIND